MIKDTSKERALKLFIESAKRYYKNNHKDNDPRNPDRRMGESNKFEYLCIKCRHWKGEQQFKIYQEKGKYLNKWCLKCCK